MSALDGLIIREYFEVALATSYRIDIAQLLPHRTGRSRSEDCANAFASAAFHRLHARPALMLLNSCEARANRKPEEPRLFPVCNDIHPSLTQAT